MICTYLNQDEFARFLNVTDEDINEALREVNSLTGDEFLIQEIEIVYRKWFKKSRRFLYTLYARLAHTEVQVINFFLDNSGWSINTTVPKPIILAYLYGQIGGIRRANTLDKEASKS